MTKYTVVRMAKYLRNYLKKQHISNTREELHMNLVQL